MTKNKVRPPTRKWRTAVGGTLLLGYAAILPGCGGGGSSSGPNQVPIRRVIAEETFTALLPTDAETVALVAFTSTAVGDLDITVDWTFETNDVDFILARGTLEQALSPACQGDSADCPLQLVSSALTLSKPEVMSVPNAAAGDYVVAVANFGTTEESGIVVVGLTTVTATSLPSVATSRSVTAPSLGKDLTGMR
jgi:hypothetical protein